jgi:hypothetical protein
MSGSAGCSCRQADVEAVDRGRSGAEFVVGHYPQNDVTLSGWLRRAGSIGTRGDLLHRRQTEI